jgi:hypothetical protein
VFFRNNGFPGHVRYAAGRSAADNSFSLPRKSNMRSPCAKSAPVLRTEIAFDTAPGQSTAGRTRDERFKSVGSDRVYARCALGVSWKVVSMPSFLVA